MPAPEKPPEKVLLLVGREEPERRVLVNRTTTVGRSSRSDLVLEGTSVSKSHARIEPRCDSYFVIDVHSRNGTFVNGVRIGPGSGVLLEDGDEVQFGGHPFRALIVAKSRRPGSVQRAAGGRDKRAKAAHTGPEAQEPQAVLRANAPPQTYEDIAADLSEVQRRAVEFAVGRHFPRADERGIEIIARYCREYLVEPLRVIGAQADFVLAECGKDSVRPEDAPRAWIRDLIVLNARVEQVFYPEAARAEEITSEGYAELRNVDFIVHGDLFPSHKSRLDDPRTWDARELLIGHKHGTSLLPLLHAGRDTGLKRRREIAAGRALRDAALDVLDAHRRLYAGGPAAQAEAGVMMTLGFFALEGGNCRHRSAALQLMLQETGAPSRYVRGALLDYGHHAWVEVDVACDGSYSFVVDPNMGVVGMKSASVPTEGARGRILQFTLSDTAKFSRTDPQSLTYVVRRREFNTIWRPRQRNPERRRADASRP